MLPLLITEPSLVTGVLGSMDIIELLEIMPSIDVLGVDAVVEN